MRKYIIGIVFTILSSAIYSQGKDTQGSIEFGTFVDIQRNSLLNDNLGGILNNKLMSNISSSGIGGSNLSRFFLTAKVTEVDKDVVQSLETMYLVKLEIHVFAADNVDNKVFGSTSVLVSGTGETELIAYKAALRNFKNNEQSVRDLITETKPKIIDYYFKNCDLVIEEAKRKESINDFDGALYLLGKTPKVCKECYSKTSLEIVRIQKNKIDKKGADLLHKSRVAWSANQNNIGAGEALGYIRDISPFCSSKNEAITLMNEISGKIDSLKKAELERLQEKMNQEYDLEKLRIESNRQIMNNYVSNLPKVIYRTHYIW